MPPVPVRKSFEIQWTLHAQAKMRHYRLSPARVRHVLHTPKRVEEGVAPKTIAAMQPASLKKSGKDETWTQEIWVMVQDMPGGIRKVISTWRYPGVSKPREAAFLQKEYQEFLSDSATVDEREIMNKRIIDKKPLCGAYYKEQLAKLSAKRKRKPKIKHRFRPSI